MKKVSIDFHGKPLSIEVGHIAKQANGSAYIRYGETSILVTAVASPKDREGIDFLPLTVDYFERFPAAGKIPGGFFKREGRPTEREILTSRLCDRPIRPLFADGYRRDTQIVATVFSYDRENESDVLAVLGTSAALHVSDIPFHGPIGAVRVGRINGKFVCNPKISEMATSDVDMIIAASKDAIVMVEGGAAEMPESEVLDALMFGFESIQPLLALQDELRSALGREKMKIEAPAVTASPLETKIRQISGSKLEEALKIREKLPRYGMIRKIQAELKDKLIAEDVSYADRSSEIGETFDDIVRSEIRNRIVKTKQRIDARATDEVRPISIEVGYLPRTHGSALFTRGETQALVTVTLGTSDDEQRVDALSGEFFRRFMLHYNFPPFSVGEVKPMRGPARREIGHGALAQRSLERMTPAHESFPYTIRVVSDILESHGSSSMATICGGTLAMMDAGVPIKAPVAGIAMGLVKEGEEFFILSDISGDEDHIGDMDFKVAGTSKGVTGIQMDIKVRGISRDVLHRALEQARVGRLHILEKMAQALASPRSELSPFAPRIETMQINTEKIRDLIGPGGKMIRSIVERTKAKIDVDDSGKVTIASADLSALQAARELVESVTGSPEIGRIYKGKVRRIMEYGAFVEIMPGTDGLLHVSQIHSESGRIDNVEDVVHEGDDIEVKVISVDHQGKIKLSQKEVIAPGSGNVEADRQGGPGGGDRDRGPRPPRRDGGRGPRREERR